MSEPDLGRVPTLREYADDRASWSLWCRKGQPEKCRRLDAACTASHSRPTPLRPPQVQPVVVEDIPVPIAGVDGYVGCDTVCNCDDESEPSPAVAPPASRPDIEYAEDDRTPERREWLLQLQSSVDDGTVWQTPPVAEQLQDHIKRLGLIPWWRNPYIGLFCRERPTPRCRLCVSPGCKCGCHA